MSFALECLHCHTQLELRGVVEVTAVINGQDASLWIDCSSCSNKLQLDLYNAQLVPGADETQDTPVHVAGPATCFCGTTHPAPQLSPPRRGHLRIVKRK